VIANDANENPKLKGVEAGVRRGKQNKEKLPRMPLECQRKKTTGSLPKPAT